MVKCKHQEYHQENHFNRVKLPDEGDFGQLKPTEKHHHTDAENSTKTKQEVSDDVAMADNPVPGVEVAQIRGCCSALVRTKRDGPMEYEANNSNDYAPGTIAPSAATMAYERSIARWYMAGDIDPDSMMLPGGVWGEVLGQLFRESMKQKDEEDGLHAQAWSSRDLLALAPDSEGL